MSKAGQIFVLSAPSGTGKSTVAAGVRKLLPSLAYSVSLTTRAPREGEVDGREYHFVSRQEFERAVAAGEMAEHAEVFGNLYGTSALVLAEALEQGDDLLLEIDIHGAAQLRPRFPQGVFIFLLPPSMAELERRLTSRGSEDPEVVARRLSRATEEMAQAKHYTHLVVNDDLDTAVDQVRSIIVAQGLRTERNLAELRALLGF